MSYRQFEQIRRASEAARLLQAGNAIADVVVLCGYSDQPHLTRALRRYWGANAGATPCRFRSRLLAGLQLGWGHEKSRGHRIRDPEQRDGSSRMDSTVFLAGRGSVSGRAPSRGQSTAAGPRHLRGHVRGVAPGACRRGRVC
ncbi:hypothetical protein [Deinococcus fonticola]|uniref:hypothetical protein n=1 Tax=Deinococcus fonticola TaxID=2528713 RepID=UPI003B82E4DD